MAGMEDAIVEDAAARLRAANVFDDVIDGVPWDAQVGELGDAVAFVEWADWSELSRTAESRDVAIRLKLWISVRSPERTTRRRRLRRLAAAASNALDGQKIAGLTQPQRTRISSGTLLSGMSGPAMTAEYVLTATYRVAGDAGHDQTDTS